MTLRAGSVVAMGIVGVPPKVLQDGRKSRANTTAELEHEFRTAGDFSTRREVASRRDVPSIARWALCIRSRRIKAVVFVASLSIICMLHALCPY